MLPNTKAFTDLIKENWERSLSDSEISKAQDLLDKIIHEGLHLPESKHSDKHGPINGFISQLINLQDILLNKPNFISKKYFDRNYINKIIDTIELYFQNNLDTLIPRTITQFAHLMFLNSQHLSKERMNEVMFFCLHNISDKDNFPQSISYMIYNICGLLELRKLDWDLKITDKETLFDFVYDYLAFICKKQIVYNRYIYSQIIPSLEIILKDFQFNSDPKFQKKIQKIKLYAEDKMNFLDNSKEFKVDLEKNSYHCQTILNSLIGLQSYIQKSFKNNLNPITLKKYASEWDILKGDSIIIFKDQTEINHGDIYDGYKNIPMKKDPNFLSFFSDYRRNGLKFKEEISKEIDPIDEEFNKEWPKLSG